MIMGSFIVKLYKLNNGYDNGFFNILMYTHLYPSSHSQLCVILRITLLLHVLLTSLLHRVDTNNVFIRLFREEGTSINFLKKVSEFVCIYKHII